MSCFCHSHHKVQKYIHWKTSTGREKRCFRMLSFLRYMPLPKIIRRDIGTYRLTFYLHLQIHCQEFPKWLLLHYIYKKKFWKRSYERESDTLCCIIFPSYNPRVKRKKDKEWEYAEQEELKNFCCKQETFIASSGPHTFNHKKLYNGIMTVVGFLFFGFF